MKSNIFKVMLVIVAMLTAAPVFGENDNLTFNNDTMSDGKLVTRETCKMVNGEAVFVSRTEISYIGNSNLIAEKREYKWNDEMKKWDFYKVYNYSYGTDSYTIVLTFASGREYSETYFR